MPLQTDSLLNTVKQGTQLTRQSAEATSSLASKAGLSQQPSTPLETAVIGGSPSQSKMAGTPAALQGQAKQIKLPTSLLLATQERREQPKALTGEEAQAAQNAASLVERLKGLGSFTNRVPSLINQAVQKKVDGIQTEETLDPSKLPATLTEEQKAEANQAVSVLKQPTTDANRQAQLDAAAKLANLTGQSAATLASPGGLDSLLTPVDVSMANAVDAATLSNITLGDLAGGSNALGYPDWTSLATDLGIQVPDGQSAEGVLTGLTVKELGQAVDAVKRKGYQTQQDWMAVLQDPTSSPSDRAVARKILQQMGASGVREAEKSVAQLSEQVQAGNQVTVNLTGVPQSIAIEDLITKPNLKAAVSILMNPNDKSYQAVAAANPGLKDWVEKHKAELANVIKDVSQDSKDLAALNAENAKVLQLPGLAADVQAKLGKMLYGADFGKITSTKYTLDSAPLLKDWSKLPADVQPRVANAISTILDAGTPADATAFLGATRDQITRLGLHTQDGLDAFNAYWNEAKLIRSIDPSTNSLSASLDLTGYSPQQLDTMTKERNAFASVGLSVGGELPANLKDATTLGSGHKKSVAEMLTEGTLPTTVKAGIGKYTASVQALVDSPNPVTSILAKAVLAADGTPNQDQIKSQAVAVIGANPDDKKGAIDTYEQLEQQAHKPGLFDDIQKNFATDIFNNALGGGPKLNQVEQAAKASPEKAQEYLDLYRQKAGNVDSRIKAEYDSVIASLQKIVDDRNAEAARAAEAQRESDRAAKANQRLDVRLSPPSSSGKSWQEQIVDVPARWFKGL